MASKSKKYKRYGVTFWFPRISVIFFVISIFAFIFQDIVKVSLFYPLAMMFMFGLLAFSAVVITWRNDAAAGIVFICLGAIFFLIARHHLLLIEIIYVSTWLTLTGLLFFLNLKMRKRRKKRSASNKIENRSLLNLRRAFIRLGPK